MTLAPPPVPLLTVAAALDAVRPGATLMVGGFGLVGAPMTLVEGLLVHPGARDLTVISNNLGEPGRGLGRLLLDGRVRKAIGSYFTSNPDVVAAYQEGRLEVELLPQGTLSEAIRAGGAGIGGFYTPTGVGTIVAEGKETRVIGGREYVLEMPIRGDLALIKGWRGDHAGNVIYRASTRNFNPMVATAGAIALAEVEELVPTGSIDPDVVVTPGIFIDAIFQGTYEPKRIEKRTNRPKSGARA